MLAEVWTTWKTSRSKKAFQVKKNFPIKKENFYTKNNSYTKKNVSRVYLPEKGEFKQWKKFHNFHAWKEQRMEKKSSVMKDIFCLALTLGSKPKYYKVAWLWQDKGSVRSNQRNKEKKIYCILI